MSGILIHQVFGDDSVLYWTNSFSQGCNLGLLYSNAVLVFFKLKPVNDIGENVLWVMIGCSFGDALCLLEESLKLFCVKGT